MGILALDPCESHGITKTASSQSWRQVQTRESEYPGVKDALVACHLIGGRRDRLLRNRRALVLIGLALSIEFLLQLLLLFLQRYNSLFPRRSLQVPVLLDEDL